MATRDHDIRHPQVPSTVNGGGEQQEIASAAGGADVQLSAEHNEHSVRDALCPQETRMVRPAEQRACTAVYIDRHPDNLISLSCKILLH